MGSTEELMPSLNCMASSKLPGLVLTLLASLSRGSKHWRGMVSHYLPVDFRC